MRIIAHRGSSHACHENTMAAFQRAHADGADGIELDLRCTADGRWIVHHDAAIDIAGSGARISELRLEQIAKLTVGPGAEPVPVFDDVLTWCRQQSMPLVLDIKDGNGLETLIETVTPYQDALPLVFSSFRKSVIRHLRHVKPQWKSALIVGNPRWRFMRRFLTGPVMRFAREQNLHALHLHERWVSPSLIQTLKQSQINLAVWTVDEPVRVQMLSLLGADAVITNRPAEARRALSEAE